MWDANHHWYLECRRIGNEKRQKKVGKSHRQSVLTIKYRTGNEPKKVHNTRAANLRWMCGRRNENDPTFISIFRHSLGVTINMFKRLKDSRFRLFLLLLLLGFCVFQLLTNTQQLTPFMSSSLWGTLMFGFYIPFHWSLFHPFCRLFAHGFFCFSQHFRHSLFTCSGHSNLFFFVRNLYFSFKIVRGEILAGHREPDRMYQQPKNEIRDIFTSIT